MVRAAVVFAGVAVCAGVAWGRESVVRSGADTYARNNTGDPAQEGHEVIANVAWPDCKAFAEAILAGEGNKR